MAGVLDGGNAIGINCGYGGCGQLNSFKQNTNANNIRIYGDNAYIFCGSSTNKKVYELRRRNHGKRFKAEQRTV